jgi:hypothetical protein
MGLAFVLYMTSDTASGMAVVYGIPGWIATSQSPDGLLPVLVIIMESTRQSW